MARPIIYAIKHKMSGMVDDYDGFTDNPQAWIKKRNRFYNDESDKPETLDDFWVDELDIEYYNNKEREVI